MVFNHFNSPWLSSYHTESQIMEVIAIQYIFLFVFLFFLFSLL